MFCEMQIYYFESIRELVLVCVSFGHKNAIALLS